MAEAADFRQAIIYRMGVYTRLCAEKSRYFVCFIAQYIAKETD